MKQEFSIDTNVMQYRSELKFVEEEIWFDWNLQILVDLGENN